MQVQQEKGEAKTGNAKEYDELVSTAGSSHTCEVQSLLRRLQQVALVFQHTLQHTVVAQPEQHNSIYTSVRIDKRWTFMIHKCVPVHTYSSHK